MKLDLLDSARTFSANGHNIKDYGKIHLERDEMVSFKTTSGKEFDFVSKEWGFYATPSINKRLKNEGFKTALVLNNENNIYVMVVENDKLDAFNEYLIHSQNNKIICWLDDFFNY